MAAPHADAIEAMLKQETEYLATHKRETGKIKQGRVTMIAWQYDIVDYLGLDRELVVVATSHFDRYFGSVLVSTLIDEYESIELVSLGCLYICLKTHGTKLMSAESMSDITGGLYAQEEIERVELTILKALMWRVNPPTAMTFVHFIMDSFSQRKEPDTETIALLNMIQLQIEASMFERNVATMKPSIVAVASMLNARDCLGYSAWVSTKLLGVSMTKCGEKEITKTRDCLYQTLVNSPLKDA